MNILRGGRADRIIYKEREGEKIPQGGIELNTSGKMTSKKDKFHYTK